MVKPIQLIAAQSATATVTGTGQNVTPGELLDAMAIVSLGAPTGAPSTQSMIVKIQASATVGGTYSDLATFNTSTSGTASVGSVQVILDPTKPFVRALATIAFTGGTAPAYPIAVTLLPRQSVATDSNLVSLA